MLLDRYFIPIAEISVSIAIPVVLTLKALQLSVLTSSGSDLSSVLRTQRILVFWVSYWLILFVLSFANVNFHFMSIFSVFYSLQSQVVLAQLLNVYETQLLPFASEVLHKTTKYRKKESDIDMFFNEMEDKLCCDGEGVNALTQFLSISTVKRAIVDEVVGSNFPSSRRYTSSPESYNIVPLEYQSIQADMDSAKANRSRRRSVSNSTLKVGNGQGFSLGKRSSWQNLRGMLNGDGDTNGSQSQHSSRISSGDIVFDEVDSKWRRSASEY